MENGTRKTFGSAEDRNLSEVTNVERQLCDAAAFQQIPGRTLVGFQNGWWRSLRPYGRGNARGATVAAECVNVWVSKIQSTHPACGATRRTHRVNGRGFQGDSGVSCRSCPQFVKGPPPNAERLLA